MTFNVAENLDYLIFCGALLMLFTLVDSHLWGARRGGVVRLLASLAMIGLLVLGGFWLQFVTNNAQRDLRSHIRGYAPIFASEMERMGHSRITEREHAGTAAYLNMIEAQKRWLSKNPNIHDVYTYRVRLDGRMALIVDSETDYNRDGVIAGEREQRTPISTIYIGPLVPFIQRALAGEHIFRGEPYHDPRGVWVTELVPMRDPSGKIEAVLGVDYDARNWANTISRARRPVFLALALATLGIIAGCSAHAQSLSQGVLHTRHFEQQRLIEEQQRFEGLVHSIDGIVWELDARTFKFNFVSQQAERILGFPPSAWLKRDSLWIEQLHRDDEWACDLRAENIAACTPYACDYRMHTKAGRTVWIRESAVVIRGKDNAPECVRGVFLDITAQKDAASELEETNRRLVETSRLAGMTEVATSVLHNVGNVLNSVNVAAGLVSQKVRDSKLTSLQKLADLLQSQQGTLAHFFAHDPRAIEVPRVLSLVTERLEQERASIIQEIEVLTKHIEHIRNIVARQQRHATHVGVRERVAAGTLVREAVHMDANAAKRAGISVVEDFTDDPLVEVEKHKVLQILLNLVRNARQALEHAEVKEKRIVIWVEKARGRVLITVSDNGPGITSEHLERIFQHGFTTKKDGHGFGLHGAAIAAKEMGGSLTAHSAGKGCGASFTLDLPLSLEPAA